MEVISQVVEELENIRDKLVIVEGHNDRKALEELGFTDVFTLGEPIFKVVERFQEKDEVVILTDLDKAGKVLYGKLAKGFARRGVRINNRIRELLFRTELRQIEGLASYINRNMKDF